MCNCASCTETDRFQGYIFEDGELIAETFPRQGFDAWPKGEHIRRSGKDKVYAAHWAFCGAEANKRGPGKFNMAMRLDGKFVSPKDTANRQAYLIPLPDNDVWIPIFEWERATGESYIDRYNQVKAENQRKAA